MNWPSDYMDTAAAAAYCQVSKSQFRARAEYYGLRPFSFMGKLLYRAADLRAAIERERSSQQSTNAGAHSSLRGRTRKGSIASRSGEFHGRKPRLSAGRKNLKRSPDEATPQAVQQSGSLQPITSDGTCTNGLAPTAAQPEYLSTR